MVLSSNLGYVFGQTRLTTDDREYVIVSLPPDDLREGMALMAQVTEPFSAAVVEGTELTLVLARTVWDGIQERLPAAQWVSGYRLIGFDLPADLELVGYIATLTNVLAEAGASVLVFSGYQRDHLLVPEADFERAWEALETFINTCRQQND